MKKKKAKKAFRKTKHKPITTKTLWFDRDNPSMTILEGRHTAEKFEKAQQREGWSAVEPETLDLKFMWLRKEGAQYTKSDINDLEAKLYTVCEA